MIYCLPAFVFSSCRLLAHLFPELNVLVETVSNNRERWVTLEDGHVVSPMEILTNDID